jgi:hypothetical protein
MNFFKKKELFANEFPLGLYLDECFQATKLFVELSSCALNDSRILFRDLDAEKAMMKFQFFKNLCLNFKNDLIDVNSFLQKRKDHRVFEKIYSSMEEVVEKSTRRVVKSKIPLPEINYLEVESVTEFDVDWILKKIKNFWNKFLQIYGSSIVDAAYKNDSSNN